MLSLEKYQIQYNSIMNKTYVNVSNREGTTRVPGKRLRTDIYR